MEFQVNVEEFAKRIKPINHVARQSKDSDDKHKIWIKADKSGMYLYSDSGGTEIYTEISKQKALSQIKYGCQQEGYMCCNGKDFINSLQSYPPDEIVRISMPTAFLSISPATDPDEIQEVPLGLPAFPYKVKKGKSKRLVKFNRKALLKGIQAVKYAIGVDEHRPQFEVMVIELLKDSVRFVAGNGAFFAIKEFMGKKVAQGKRPSQIILPKSSIGNIISMLSNSLAETVEIKKYPRNKQLFLKTDTSTLRIKEQKLWIKEQKIKDYPDVDIILCDDHPFIITSLLDEWYYPVKAMRATLDDEMIQDCCVHNVSITVDLNVGQFILEANYKSTARATIPFTMNTRVHLEKQSIKLCCNSAFLADMVNNFGSGGEIKFKFVDSSRPVVVSSPVRFCKQLGIEVQDICLFATSQE